jgi:hypothetical protein
VSNVFPRAGKEMSKSVCLKLEVCKEEEEEEGEKEEEEEEEDGETEE